MYRKENKKAILIAELRYARAEELRASREFEDGLIDYESYRAICDKVDRLQAELDSL